MNGAPHRHYEQRSHQVHHKQYQPYEYYWYEDEDGSCHSLDIHHTSPLQHASTTTEEFKACYSLQHWHHGAADPR